MLSLLAFCALSSPNVVVIVTDDQGYGDLSCHGNPVVRTPHLDALHDASVRLTDFHVAPMCTPTRGQLLTGIDAIENRAMNVSSGRELLREGLPTIADHLKAAGYATHLAGKWHLGDNAPFRPIDRGFDTALSFPSSHIGSVPDFWNNDYFDDTYISSGVVPEPFETRLQVPGYCTDVWFGEAIELIEKHEPNDSPFFLYLATNAPHSPHFVPDRYRDPVRERLAAAEASGEVTLTKPKQREALVSFLAMIENIDENVGRLMDAIPDDTLVIFLTDNGSTFGETYFNAGMRGRKTQLWEGGHRVPCFIKHESLSPQDVSGLTHAQDLAPTILDFCDAEPVGMDGRAFDGQSLRPAIEGTADVPDRTLVINYSRMPFSFNVRPNGDPASLPTKEGAGVLRGPWRLIHLDQTEGGELYHVGDDPMQATNVAADHPEVVAELTAYLDGWWDGILADGDPTEPERVVISGDPQQPSYLTACEWLDVFIDQQKQVRRGDRKTGVLHLRSPKAGIYRLEFRRFPDESGLALTDAVEATEVVDGTLIAGPALPIDSVLLTMIQGGEATVTPNIREQLGNSLTTTISLDEGPFDLQADFYDQDHRQIVGAYYVTITAVADAAAD